MQFEMESDLFSLLEERPGANFDSQSPTVNSGELNLGVDDNTRYQMTTNRTTDQALVYSQDSPVHNRVHRGVNRQYSEFDLMEIRRQREINKAKKEAADLDQSFILEKLAQVEPVAVTFFDEATGIKFDADGNEISSLQDELNNAENLHATDRARLINTRERGNPLRGNSFRENANGRKSYRASPFNTQDDRRRHQGAARNPRANPCNVGVYQTDQHPHLLMNQPVHQKVNKKVDQENYQRMSQPRNEPLHQPMRPPMNPQNKQQDAVQYPQNATTQPDNRQNVWSTNQPQPIITQQPFSLTAQPTFYGQPQDSVTQQNVRETESYGCYIVMSVIGVIFCWTPAAFAGLFFSIKACSLFRDGQYVKAEHHAKTGCIFIVIALLAGIIIWGLNIGLCLTCQICPFRNFEKCSLRAS